jgi:ribosomal protein S18 acetylase RimI-like enzyme
MNQPKRLVMKIKLPIENKISSSDFRLVTEKDVNDLALIMLEAYRGTIDSEGEETLSDAIGEVQGTLDGKYGKFLWKASMIADVEAVPAAAIMFTWSEKENMPFLAFSMTHANFKGNGLATRLIKVGLNKLTEEGYRECALMVTDGNEPALTIYKKLGFVIQ